MKTYLCSKCNKKLNFLTVITEIKDDKEIYFCSKCDKKREEEIKDNERKSKIIKENSQKVKYKDYKVSVFVASMLTLLSILNLIVSSNYNLSEPFGFIGELIGIVIGAYLVWKIIFYIGVSITKWYRKKNK